MGPILYTGLHLPYLARHLDTAMLSVNVLERRRSDFGVNRWIMDSGAFTRVTSGRSHMPLDDYARQIDRWSRCGTLEAAVT